MPARSSAPRPVAPPGSPPDYVDLDASHRRGRVQGPGPGTAPGAIASYAEARDGPAARGVVRGRVAVGGTVLRPGIDPQRRTDDFRRGRGASTST